MKQVPRPYIYETGKHAFNKLHIPVNIVYDRRNVRSVSDIDVSLTIEMACNLKVNYVERHYVIASSYKNRFPCPTCKAMVKLKKFYDTMSIKDVEDYYRYLVSKFTFKYYKRVELNEDHFRFYNGSWWNKL